MTQDEMKQKAAEAALEYVIPDEIVGVGTCLLYTSDAADDRT